MTEKIGLEAVFLDDQFQAGMKRYMLGVNAMSSATDDMQAGAKQISKSLQGVDQSVEDSAQSNIELAASIEIVEKAYEQAKQVFDKGMGLAQLGAQFDRQERRFEAFAAGAGGAAANLEAFQRGAGGTVNKMEAMTSASRLLQMGLVGDATEMEKVVEIATRLGDQTQSAGTRVGDFALMLANTSVPRLDSYGLSAGYVRDRMVELQAANEDMTREQAFAAAVFEASEESLGKLGDRVEDNAAKMEMAKARAEDLQIEWGQKLAGAAGSLSEFMAGLSDETLTLITMMTGGIGVAVKFGGSIKSMIKKMKDGEGQTIALTTAVIALIGTYEAARQLGEKFTDGQQNAAEATQGWTADVDEMVKSGMTLKEAMQEISNRVNETNDALHANKGPIDDFLLGIVRATSEEGIWEDATKQATIAIGMQADSVEEMRIAIAAYNDSLENDQARIELTDENLRAAVANQELREATLAAAEAEEQAAAAREVERDATNRLIERLEVERELRQAATVAILEQAEALSDASAEKAAEAAIAGLTAQLEAGILPLDAYTMLVENLQDEYGLVTEQGRALAEGQAELTQQLANGEITLSQYQERMTALIDARADEIAAAEALTKAEEQTAQALEDTTDAQENATQAAEDHTKALIGQAEALSDASAAEAVAVAMDNLEALMQEGVITLQEYDEEIRKIQDDYGLISEEGRVLADGISALDEQLRDGSLTMEEYREQLDALIQTETDSIAVREAETEAAEKLAKELQAAADKALKDEEAAQRAAQKAAEDHTIALLKQAEALSNVDAAGAAKAAMSGLETLFKQGKMSLDEYTAAAAKIQDNFGLVNDEGRLLATGIDALNQQYAEGAMSLDEYQRQLSSLIDIQTSSIEARKVAEELAEDVEDEMTKAADAAAELPGRLFDALSGLGSIAMKTLQDEIDPLDEELGRIDDALELWKQALEDPTADLQDQERSLKEIEALESERAVIAKERAEQEARIAEFQAAQQQMALLQQQLDLMELVQEHGLDAQEVLGGLTADASASEIVDATTAAMQQIIAQTQSGLNFGGGGVDTSATMTQAPVFSSPTGGGSTVNSQSNTFELGGNNINNGMDAAQLESMIRRVLAEAI